jgi:hypothetical protein
MVTKWIIEITGLELYRFDHRKELWKLAFKSKSGKSISAKKIKKDTTKKRWKLNAEWWSENQLRPHIALDKFPIQLTKETDLPF